jgi:hypothetical protein
LTSKTKALEFRPPAEDSSSPAKIPRSDPNQGQSSRSKCQFHPDGSDHFSKACPSEARERKDSLRKQRKCFNCFKTGHVVRDCVSPNNCLNLCCEKTEAGRRHHTFVCLHPGRFTSKKKPYNPTRGPSFEGGRQNDPQPAREALTANFVAEQIENFFRNQAPRSATVNVTTGLPSTSRPAICGSDTTNTSSQPANRTD